MTNLDIVNITVNKFSGEGVKPVYREGQPEYLPGLHVLVWSRRSRRTCLVWWASFCAGCRRRFFRRLRNSSPQPWRSCEGPPAWTDRGMLCRTSTSTPVVGSSTSAARSWVSRLSRRRSHHGTVSTASVSRNSLFNGPVTLLRMKETRYYTLTLGIGCIRFKHAGIRWHTLVNAVIR